MLQALLRCWAGKGIKRAIGNASDVELSRMEG